MLLEQRLVLCGDFKRYKREIIEMSTHHDESTFCERFATMFHCRRAMKSHSSGFHQLMANVRFAPVSRQLLRHE